MPLIHEIADADLLRVLLGSPYKGLVQVEWLEFNDEISDIVNSNWTSISGLERTILKFFTGAILINQNKGIFITCLEIYSRFGNVDAHHERNWDPSFRSSFPDDRMYHDKNIYNGICVMNRSYDNMNQLIIGLRTSNLLVVGSKRIDETSPVQLGPTTLGFSADATTKIFLNAQYVRTAIINMDKKKTTISRWL